MTPTVLDLVTVRNLKTTETRRGVYWRCDLLFAGQLVARVENPGDGSATLVRAEPGQHQRLAEITAAATEATGEAYDALDGVLSCMLPGMTGTQGAADYRKFMARA